MGQTTQRRNGREKAKPLLKTIDEVASSLSPQERRGFLQKLHRGIYDRRKPLYPHGLHPNQKS